MNSTELAKYNASLVKHTCSVKKMVPVAFFNNETESCDIKWEEQKVKETCVFLFEKVARSWNDTAVGICLLILALFILCVCLVLIVKLLHSLLRGKIAVILKKFINSDFPGCAKHLTGYLAILLGAGLTMLVQSSSIFTSAITPLVGVGVLHLDRMYPLTLGANIGTTFTAILAALASDADRLHITLQVALCHLFFNIIGIIIWYPVPAMRKVPISLAKKLGNTTAKYRWFALVYLFLMFFLFPGAIFGLSVAGTWVIIGVGVPILVFFIIIIIINRIQAKAPHRLPKKLQNWDFLPKPLRSLEPYDRIFVKIKHHCCCKACRDENDNNDIEKTIDEEKSNALNAYDDMVEIKPESNDQANGHANGQANGHVKSVHVNSAYEHDQNAETCQL